ncbi:MAG: ribosome maturation factor RimP [Burkholderiales bacterium]
MDLGIVLTQTVSGLGYELVDWEKPGRGGLLRLYIDKPGGINVDDCAAVSRQVSRVLEVERVGYDRLEVSSPGLDRALKQAGDFTRFTGERAKVRLRLPLDGQRNFVGTISGVEDGAVVLAVEGRTVRLELANVESARLAPDAPIKGPRPVPGRNE